MKHSLYMAGLVVVVSFFSGSLLADGVTRVQLSSTPIIKATIVKTHHVTSRRVSERLRHKGRTQKTRYLRTNNLRKKRVDARKRVARLRVKPLVKYHYIKSGDSLYKIAKKYKVTVKHLMHVNHLKSSVIKIGARLKI